LCIKDALNFLTRKLRNWGINSPLVESLITAMFEDQGSLEDPSSSSWLGYLIRYLTTDLALPLPRSSIAELRSSLLAFTPEYLTHQITRRCHQSCYPPSLSREPMFHALNLPTALAWPCFESTSTHFHLSRFFISDSFRHSKLLFSSGIARICPSCDESLTIAHWFFCPLRADDRMLLHSETGIYVDSFEKLREVVSHPRHCIVLEFVLSRFFKWSQPGAK
jgi:hypothetical protein